jgi:hypothetical protein
MFRWFRAMGCGAVVQSLRQVSARLSLPDFALYSAPFALWLLGYLLCVRAIWLHHPSRMRHFWFWVLPSVSILLEFLQLTGFCPGTFDENDVFALALATLLASFIP